MAGMPGVSYRSFVLYDGLGAVLWATLGIWTGSAFAHELERMIGRFKDAQLMLAYLAGAALLLFILVKWLVRRRHGRAEIVMVSDIDGDAPGGERI